MLVIVHKGFNMLSAGDLPFISLTPVWWRFGSLMWSLYSSSAGCFLQTLVIAEAFTLPSSSPRSSCCITFAIKLYNHLAAVCVVMLHSGIDVKFRGSSLLTMKQILFLPGNQPLGEIIFYLQSQRSFG